VWFSRLLGVLSVLLLVVTVIAIPATAIIATGRGDMTLGVRLDPPYSIGLDAAEPMFTDPEDAGRRILVTDDGIAAYENFPAGKEQDELTDAPRIRAKVHVDRDDRDTRALVLALLIVTVGLGWVALENVRRVVKAARDGRAFDVRNVTRLRWAAAAVVAFPFLARFLYWRVGEALDSTLNVSPNGAGVASLAGLGVGLGLLALAEVFRAGSELSGDGSPAP
jgi:hypothetical protein